MFAVFKRFLEAHKCKKEDKKIAQSFKTTLNVYAQRNRMKLIREFMDNPKFIMAATRGVPDTTPKKVAEKVVDGLYSAGALTELYEPKMLENAVIAIELENDSPPHKSHFLALMGFSFQPPKLTG